MHPGQRRRLMRERAERTGSPVEVHRHGRRIATIRRSDTGRWTVDPGGHQPPDYPTVEAAEGAAIAAAVTAEAVRRRS